MDDRVRKLQNLLVVVTGRPVVLTRLLVCADATDGRDSWLEVSFEATQPAASDRVSATQFRNYDAPTLLLPDDPELPFDALTRAWLEHYDEIDDVVTRLCAPSYAPFIYSEHSYGSVFQAAEGLAKLHHKGRQRTPEEHRARVGVVVKMMAEAGFDQTDQDWARNLLAGRNDKPLKDLLRELITDLGKIGQAILSLDVDVPALATRVRTGVSHSRAKNLTAADRYWLGQLLTWVVRARLLDDLGMPLATAEKRILANPGFQQACLEVAKIR